MKKLIGLLVAVLMVVLNAVPVLAIGEPDTDPTVSNLHINRNLIEDGDVLVYGDYYIPYGTVPAESATDTYLVRVFEDATELGSVPIYAMFDHGFNHGVFGVYLETGFTWASTHSIRVAQSPAYFASPDVWSFEIPTGAYTAMLTQDSNQTELAINIISAATRMQEYFEDETFIESGPDRTVLSSPTGENYFRGAIPGIQFMAPSLFYFQAVAEDVEPHAWTTAQFDIYAARFDGTWVGDDATRTADQFGANVPNIMAMIFILPICLGAVILTSVKWKKVEPGYNIASMAIIMGGMMGWFPTALMATYLQCCAIYLSFVIFYSRG